MPEGLALELRFDTAALQRRARLAATLVPLLSPEYDDALLAWVLRAPLRLSVNGRPLGTIRLSDGARAAA